jgi:peptide/nickel transport system permease protein
VLRRLAALVPSALGVSLLIFLLMHLIPGTVVDQMIGTEARVGEEARQAMRAFFGLDRPLHGSTSAGLAEYSTATSA